MPNSSRHPHRTGWRCQRCKLPYEYGPTFGRHLGLCWPCVRAMKGMTGGQRRTGRAA